MRYTHSFKAIKKWHAIASVFILLLIATVLITMAWLTETDLNQFFRGFALSFMRVVVAYLLSIAFAIPVGILTVRNKTLEGFLLPILDLLQSFPSFAILPVAVLVFGPTSTTAIIFLFITIVWPILFNVVAGVKGIRQDLLEAAEIFGATGWKKIWYVQLPLLLPAIVTGSIVGWGEGWEAIVGAELIGISTGVGAYLYHVSSAGQTRVLVAAMLLFLFCIFVLNKFIWLPLLKKATAYQTE